MDEFHRNPSSRDGHKGDCKPCAIEMARTNYYANREARLAQKKAAYAADPAKHAESNRRWRERNPDKVRALDIKRYRITPDEYDALLASQAGVCAVCGGLPGGRRKNLDVDHDHDTGQVRGLLCNRCNLVLGKVQDDSELLNLLAEYVRSAARLSEARTLSTAGSVL